MNRIVRQRLLTADEASYYNQVRERIRAEFPLGFPRRILYEPPQPDPDLGPASLWALDPEQLLRQASVMWDCFVKSRLFKPNGILTCDYQRAAEDCMARFYALYS